MVSKRLSIWLREEENQDRLRVWIGAAAAALISILTVPGMAEAKDVRIVRADGAVVQGDVPAGITMVNRRSKFVFVDPAEFAPGLAGGPSEPAYRSNLYRVKTPRTKTITVYTGNRVSEARSLIQ